MTRRDPTFGPDYDVDLDGPRVRRQMDVIRELMLSRWRSGAPWLTLSEIERATGYPQNSISAQLRHLRKARFGSYDVTKRRRGEPKAGLWEYRVRPEFTLTGD